MLKDKIPMVLLMLQKVTANFVAFLFACGAGLAYGQSANPITLPKKNNIRYRKAQRVS